MSSTLNKLQPIKLQNEPSGKYGDGGGLWLHKRDKDHGKWVLLFRIYGKRREMGLGSYPDVSLKEARESAHHWRSVVREGKDPIKERERLRKEAARERYTLEVVADQAFEARKAELKGDGIAGRWFTPLKLHVLPRLGRTPVGRNQ